MQDPKGLIRLGEEKHLNTLKFAVYLFSAPCLQNKSTTIKAINSYQQLLKKCLLFEIMM